MYFERVAGCKLKVSTYGVLPLPLMKVTLLKFIMQLADFETSPGGASVINFNGFNRPPYSVAFISLAGPDPWGLKTMALSCCATPLAANDASVVTW
jgi:hypothetical protein